jgi:hypothetical protein
MGLDRPEQFIQTVDTGLLRALRWPMLRLLARGYVEARELCRVERDLLASGDWSMVRVQRHPVEDDGRASHLYDVFGVPREDRPTRR